MRLVNLLYTRKSAQVNDERYPLFVHTLPVGLPKSSALCLKYCSKHSFRSLFPLSFVLLVGD